jgi:hypothetical protein
LAASLVIWNFLSGHRPAIVPASLRRMSSPQVWTSRRQSFANRVALLRRMSLSRRRNHCPNSAFDSRQRNGSLGYIAILGPAFRGAFSRNEPGGNAESEAARLSGSPFSRGGHVCPVWPDQAFRAVVRRNGRPQGWCVRRSDIDATQARARATVIGRSGIQRAAFPGASREATIGASRGDPLGFTGKLLSPVPAGGRGFFLGEPRGGRRVASGGPSPQSQSSGRTGAPSSIVP